MRGITTFIVEYFSPFENHRYVCEHCRNKDGTSPRAICRITSRRYLYMCRTCVCRLLASVKVVEQRYVTDPKRPKVIARQKREDAKRQKAAAQGG